MALKFSGLARLERKLKAIPLETIKQVRLSMEQSAEAVVAMAKSLAAEDDGDLIASIGWTWGKAPKGSITLGKILRNNIQGNNTITIYAGDNKAFYARWVEFGIAPHINGGIFAGTQHPGTAPQPFFFPAYRANKRAMKRRMRDAVRKSAKIVAGR